MNQWQGIEVHETYEDKLTGCCQEGQVHHTLSERLSTNVKIPIEMARDELYYELKNIWYGKAV